MEGRDEVQWIAKLELGLSIPLRTYSILSGAFFFFLSEFHVDVESVKRVFS